MGPGLALLAFGEEAAVPVALIFCFENIMHFAIAPMMMALSGGEQELAAADWRWAWSGKIVLHPFIIATAAGVARGLFRVPAARAGRALSGLSVARRRTLRAVCHGRDAGAAAAEARAGRARADRRCSSSCVHPALCYVVLSCDRQFLRSLGLFGGAACRACRPRPTSSSSRSNMASGCERASASILITTLLSVGTVTALLYLIKSGMLPPDLFP